VSKYLGGMTWEQVRARQEAIAAMLLDGLTFREIGERYGISRQAVHKVVTRMRKRVDKMEREA
jgi:predicted DNA-binding protein YlxM (UPF0122 family)